MLTFELQEPHSSSCECCGGVTTSLTRFVYEDGDAYAIYYARFGMSHEPRVVLASCRRGISSQPDGRGGVSLGRRGAARPHARPGRGPGALRLRDVFHISDHMVRDDAPLRDYLNGAA
jgi:hypothetical protein